MTDIHEDVMNYAKVGCWDKVTREIEEFDLRRGSTYAPKPVCVFGIFGYLILNDLENATLFWKRLPLEYKSDENINQVRGVVAALTENDVAKAHQLLAAEWNPEVTVAVTSLQSSLRTRTMKLLPSAYSVIRAAKAESLLGVTKEELTLLASQASWEYDTETDAYKFKQIEEVNAIEGANGVEAVEAVAKHALFLEQFANPR
eukprot:TRINITY_DN14975_c0_g2_i1.p1 TRINITY_DN14975_c0_g2~~TRINITY_DN14975_c0_g2_i1.p1  ORF type:complete len:202 (+),score=46.07 TRINITY_DN14975_c0_g2_i1:58-663(+)